MSNGWCLTSSSCSTPSGLTDSSYGSASANKPWILCTNNGYQAPSPPPKLYPPPPPDSCNFLRRTEDADLIKRTAGIQIWSCSVVNSTAVRYARMIIEGQMATAPQSILDSLSSEKTIVAIFGNSQLITDLPPFSFLRGKLTFDGRSYSTVNGLGGVLGNPSTGIGEKNLLWLADDPYTNGSSWEVVLVHEWAHSVMDLGFSQITSTSLQSVFNATLLKYKPQFPAGKAPYAFSNSLEFWAVYSESWFESCLRTDTNLGFFSRSLVGANIPLLTSFFQSTYGSSPWAYSMASGLPQYKKKPPPSGSVGASKPQVQENPSKRRMMHARDHQNEPSREEYKKLVAEMKPEERWIRP